jgi:hypothetical protein
MVVFNNIQSLLNDIFFQQHCDSSSSQGRLVHIKVGDKFYHYCYQYGYYFTTKRKPLSGVASQILEGDTLHRALYFHGCDSVCEHNMISIIFIVMPYI